MKKKKKKRTEITMINWKKKTQEKKIHFFNERRWNKFYFDKKESKINVLHSFSILLFFNCFVLLIKRRKEKLDHFKKDFLVCIYFPL